MRRRLLLKGSAALTLVVAGGLVWRGKERGVFAEPTGAPFSPWELWRAPEIKDTPLALVAAGILASNPHNTQPWIFRIRDAEVEVLADTRRNLGSFDPYLREAHIGLGCAIENMMLAAQANGFTATLEADPGSLLGIKSRVEPVRAAVVKLDSVAGGLRRPPSTRRSRIVAPIGMDMSARGRFRRPRSMRSRLPLRNRSCGSFSSTQEQCGSNSMPQRSRRPRKSSPTSR